MWSAQRAIENEQAKVQIEGEDVFLHPGSEIRNAGRSGAIRIGSYSHIGGQLLVFPVTGKIEIGDFCSIGPGTRIWSQEEIMIGHHVLISHTVAVMDTDGHEASADARSSEVEHIMKHGLPMEKGTVKTAPVHIGNHVWIGCHSIILKGVSIGDRTIVGAGSVVTKSLPADCIAVGNPARIVQRGY